MKATVLIPTHSHASLLPYSLQSVLKQTIKDIEILVIGDGVQDDTREVMKKFIKQDKRIRFFDFPKGPRNGEIYRNKILKSAKGEIVCYLSDDDLWFTDHIEIMTKLLRNADFANSYLFRIEADGSISKAFVDLKLSQYRKMMLNGISFVALSFGAHRLSFYKKLPFGWRTTPQGIYTDHYMWQQFLREKKCRAVSGFIPSVINAPSFLRKDIPMNRRADEIRKWSENLEKREFVESFRKDFFEETIRGQAVKNLIITELRETIQRVKNTKTWKLHEKLERLPALKIVKSVWNFFRI